MKRWLMMILVLTQVSLLISCSSMNSSFDCPNKVGVNCKSLDQINAMVDRGDINNRVTGEINDSANHSSFHVLPTYAMYHVGEPIRYGESVQRIWIAPYEDTEGNYHQDSLIYTIMQGGHWIGKQPHVSALS